MSTKLYHPKTAKTVGELRKIIQGYSDDVCLHMIHQTGDETYEITNVAALFLSSGGGYHTAHNELRLFPFNMYSGLEPSEEDFRIEEANRKFSSHQHDSSD